MAATLTADVLEDQLPVSLACILAAANKQAIAFLRSVSAIFTRLSPTTSRIAKSLRNTLNNKKQRLMLFKNKWNLILSIKAQSGSCVHGFYLDGQNGIRATAP